MGDGGVLSGSRLALLGMVGLVYSSEIEADDNSNMEICNIKQCMYYISKVQTMSIIHEFFVYIDNTCLS